MKPAAAHIDQVDASRRELLASLETSSRLLRRRALSVLAHRDGFSIHQIAKLAALSRNSVRRYLEAYRAGGWAGFIQ